MGQNGQHRWQARQHTMKGITGGQKKEPKEDEKWAKKRLGAGKAMYLRN